MQFNRRDFLRSAGLTLLAGATVSPKVSLGAGPGASDWETLRASFNLDPKKTHMALLLLASHPKPVRDAIEGYRRMFDSNPVDTWEEKWSVAEEGTRTAAAKYLGAEAGEVALTDSTTMGLALLYGGIRLKAGQEILTTTHEHYSTYESFRMRTARTGNAIRKVALYTDSANVTEEGLVANLVREISDQTRVVAVTWVHSSTGVKLPIRRMADRIAKLNVGRALEDRILFCVDGVHGFGIENVTMDDLGCDFFVAGCHKWLFGPRGTGLIYGRRTVNSQVEPMIPSFSFPKTNWGQQMTPGGFHSFEHRWALGQAFELHLSLGKARVETRIHQLNTEMKDRLAKITGVTIYTPRSAALSSGIVCFDVAGVKPKDVLDRLAKKNIIASTTPYAVSYARVTPGLLNTSDEVAKVAEAVENISRGA